VYVSMHARTPMNERRFSFVVGSDACLPHFAHAHIFLSSSIDTKVKEPFCTVPLLSLQVDGNKIVNVRMEKEVPAYQGRLRDLEESGVSTTSSTSSSSSTAFDNFLYYRPQHQPPLEQETGEQSNNNNNNNSYVEME
jgi:hypothetical protein